MIKIIRISGFKSLNGFEMKLSKFNCLIGLNGAGKSSVLQALDFAGAIASDQLDKWLYSRSLNIADISSNLLPRKKNIDISIFFEFENGLGEVKTYGWRVALSRGLLSLNIEVFAEVKFDEDDNPIVLKNIFNYKAGVYKFYKNESITNHYAVSGSMLANFSKQKSFSEIELSDLDAFRFLQEIKSFELLSPNLLRRKQKKDPLVSDIGIGGEFLGSFVNNLSLEQRAELLKDLREFYPSIISIDTKVRKFGWVELSVSEGAEYKVNERLSVAAISHTAKVMNDGLLRVIAILAQKFSEHKVILFDEIENGVNSEVTERIVDALMTLNKQVVVTSHSPMVLNYIPEDEAIKSVHLVYRGKSGVSKEVLFFHIPSVAEKLDFLAPGDAMLDVHLETIAHEADKLELENAPK